MEETPCYGARLEHFPHLMHIGEEGEHPVYPSPSMPLLAGGDLTILITGGMGSQRFSGYLGHGTHSAVAVKSIHGCIHGHASQYSPRSSVYLE